MKVNFDKVDVIIIKDSEGKVIEHFTPKQVTHSHGGIGNNALIFVK